MSTKTTFKRIALVTVAALGFGLLTVTPSTATPASDTLSIALATKTVAINTATSTTLTQTFLGVGGDTMTVTVTLVSSPAGNTVMPTLTALPTVSSGGTFSVNSATLVGTYMDTHTQGGSTYGLNTVS